MRDERSDSCALDKTRRQLAAPRPQTCQSPRSTRTDDTRTLSKSARDAPSASSARVVEVYVRHEMSFKVHKAQKAGVKHTRSSIASPGVRCGWRAFPCSFALNVAAPGRPRRRRAEMCLRHKSRTLSQRQRRHGDANGPLAVEWVGVDALEILRVTRGHAVPAQRPLPVDSRDFTSSRRAEPCMLAPDVQRPSRR
jgi:hypothetical protein